NALSKMSGLMPACKAWARKPACQSLKRMVGWISRFASTAIAGALSATGAIGNVLAMGRGVASAAVGFSAQATNRTRLEAAISWRNCQRREKQEGMLGSKVLPIGADLNTPARSKGRRGEVAVFQAARR